MSGPFVLLPLTITDAILSASSIAEPASGETAWVSGSTYVLGDVRIDATTHRKYECVLGHTGRTARPGVDDAYWLDAGPTLKWAAFDDQTTSASTTVTSYSVTLLPGFCNGVCVYNAVGSSYSLVVKDAPGGSIIDTRTGTLIDPPKGFYDYFFGRRMRGNITKLVFKDLPLRPNAEITLTITASAGQPAGAGMIAVGHLRPLLGSVSWGGVEQGAEVAPFTYSYLKTDDYGNTVIKRRPSGSDISIRIALPRTALDGAVALVQQLLDVPVCLIGTDAQGYAGLNGFGLITATGNYGSFNTASLTIKLKGMI